MPSPPAESTRGTGDAAGRRILVLFAHPSLDHSEVNRPLAEATANLAGVTLVDLYAEYPNFDINIDREQARLGSHEAICFMHPLYWYSTPAILKEWQDLVLEYGFAYGSGATALHGKLFFNTLTAGGAESAYSATGANHFSIRELLNPLEQMARLCGMVFLPPFALFSARTAMEDGRLDRHLADWVRLLAALRDDRLDLMTACRQATLNANLDDLIRDG